jgi:hypothetical protein
MLDLGARLVVEQFAVDIQVVERVVVYAVARLDCIVFP